MRRTPRHLPVLTAGLLAGGMSVFLLKNLFSVPVEKVFVAVGMAIFLAGLIVALGGAVWSICTLTNAAQRRLHGITTPVVTILIAALAWSGTLLTVYKYKKSSEVRTEAAAEAAREAEERVP